MPDGSFQFHAEGPERVEAVPPARPARGAQGNRPRRQTPRGRRPGLGRPDQDAPPPLPQRQPGASGGHPVNYPCHPPVLTPGITSVARDDLIRSRDSPGPRSPMGDERSQETGRSRCTPSFSRVVIIAEILQQSHNPGQATLTGWSRNLITAREPRTIKTIIETTWAIKNGGSDCVGAMAFRAGTFWKDWTISTRKLR